VPRERKAITAVIPGCAFWRRPGISRCTALDDHLWIPGSRESAPRNDGLGFSACISLVIARSTCDDGIQFLLAAPGLLRFARKDVVEVSFEDCITTIIDVVPALRRDDGSNSGSPHERSDMRDFRGVVALSSNRRAVFPGYRFRSSGLQPLPLSLKNFDRQVACVRNDGGMNRLFENRITTNIHALPDKHCTRLRNRYAYASRENTGQTDDRPSS
jgi:hypothetical protein